MFFFDLFSVLVSIISYTYFSEEFANPKWEKIFRKIILQRCANGIWSNSEKSSHDVISPLVEIDLFGQWEKDLLFGHLKILLKTKDGKPFPKYWKVDENKVF